MVNVKKPENVDLYDADSRKLMLDFILDNDNELNSFESDFIDQNCQLIADGISLSDKSLNIFYQIYNKICRL